MPAYAAKMTDQEIADVTIYIRNAWGNAAPLVTAAVFAPTEPGEDRALQMRALADAFAADVAAGQTVSARVAAALSPRPLLYARR